MTSPLPIATHVFMLTWWLTQQVTGLTQSKLDMAYNAFDDQYEGCIQEMEKKAPQLLNEELKINEQLKSEWAEAKEHWEQIKYKIKRPKNFNDFHGIALVAYTGSISKDFNTAVREFRQNSNNFKYKAFHYYLTRALQLLKEQNCHLYHVYRGTHTKFYYSGEHSVRFGQFTSSSWELTEALQFYSEGGTLFKINTCLGVYIKAFSLYPDEEEVLIPGYEVYKKVAIKQTDKYTEITLKDPQRQRSNYNCFYVSKNPSNFNSSGMIKGAEFLVLLLPNLLILLLLYAEL
ncbi:PREDICTED: T-cell ecto-ADP-ribosyltransferase 1-like [Chinchilla lanigera]|uniref:NAD(P)(+)--arginine ADP-ribosyltransferase n=1 Tax=Chinchilla lanigera TaxID=34839 RepID=A0A8C2VYH2_CHILA|nr:PREDICTED: T-cell ecto-ADP-ribosyltransferase 1-like [Chinchilla lanigera]